MSKVLWYNLFMGNFKESLQKALSPDYDPGRRQVIKGILWIGGTVALPMTLLDALTLNRDVKIQALQEKPGDPNISKATEQHPPLNLYARYPLRSLRPFTLAIITSLLLGTYTSILEDQNKLSKTP